MGKKQELGKGIRALLKTMDDDTSGSVQSAQKDAPGVTQIAIAHIRANPDQPRNHFDEEQLEELAQSIQSLGVIQPLTLRKISHNDYQIIAGERRFRASKMAGLKEVPSYIREANDAELLEMALVENIQRQDLNPVEVAISFERLIRECNITQEALSERVGKKRSTIANYVRLLKLPPEVQQALKKEIISMGHARALAGVDDPMLLMKHFKVVLEKSLSVRKTEELVSAVSKAKKTTKVTSEQSPEIRKIVDRLSAHFGTRIRLDRTDSGKGKISIPFNSDSELNNILDLLED